MPQKQQRLKSMTETLAVENMTDTDVENLKAAIEALKNEFYKISEKLYQQNQQAQGGEAQQGAGGADSDVVDGDYKEM